MRAIRSTRAVVVALGLLALAAGAAPAAADTTVNVNTTADETLVGDGSCSLREALLLANGQPGGNDCGSGQTSGTVTIVLPAGHYALTHRGLVLARAGAQITIQGAGAAGTTIDAHHTDNALLVDSGADARISAVTVTGGEAPPGSDGASGTDGGQGGFGGGISNFGTLALADATVTGNAAGDGGAGGNSTGTATGGTGGGGADGGGIFNAGTLTATNTTIATNAAGNGGEPTPSPGTGGGLAQFSKTGATLTSVTIAENTALEGGSGTQASSGPLTITSSVIGANGVQPCGGTITNGGFNLTAQAAECPGTTLGDPKLGPLQDNGGPTETMSLAPGSPAIDLVPAGPFCPPTDQRGVHRPQGKACDAGAYELAPLTIAQATAAATSPTTATMTASVNPNLQDTAFTVTYGPTGAPSSTTPPLDLGAGNTPVAASIPVGALQPNATIHVEITAANADGTSHSTDITLTTPPVGGPPAPAITRLRQTARPWIERAARRRERIARSHRLPIGTTFTFQLNESARVTLQFIRLRRGHRTRSTGTLTVTGHAGANRIRFLGRLPRHRTLTPGRYQLVMTATNPDGERSATARLTFTIVAGAERAR